jgi:hypothetical protein
MGNRPFVTDQAISSAVVFNEDLSTAASRARTVLEANGISSATAEVIACAVTELRLKDLREPRNALRPLLGGDLRRVCEYHADSVARRLSDIPGRFVARLTEGGWLIPDVTSAPIQQLHVYAVCALMAFRAAFAASELKRWRDVDRLAAVSLALANDALFMDGRAVMKRDVEAASREKRSRDGSLGGAPKKVADKDLLDIRAAFYAKHPNAKRGLIKFARLTLETEGMATMTDRQLGKRFRKLELQEQTNLPGG